MGARGGRSAAAGAYRAQVLAQREAFFAKSGLSASELRNNATLVRKVSRNSTLQFTIDTSDNSTFRCALVAPKSAQAPSMDGPPRTTANKLMMYWLNKNKGVQQPVLNAGARVNVDGVDFEYVSGSRAMRYGTTVHALRAEVVPVEVLWPISADLQELGGAHIKSVPLALWEGETDTVKGRGAYDEISGEVPCDFAADLIGHRNRQLVVGSFTFRVQSAMPHFQQPAIKLRLTRAI